jgi:catechol 2,3-dioxygenase-like lactoylglutathione lyase family enzyme
MLDHVSLGVRDIRRSRHFYDHALRPLGLVRIVDFGNGRGSDYGVAPGSLGVEFTITREPEGRARRPSRRAPENDRKLSREYPMILQAWLTLPSCLASS